MKPRPCLHRRPAAFIALSLAAALVGCSSRPAEKPVPAAARDCKTTRNIQGAGPQPPARPPRCENSIDAGRLPAQALPPIIP